MTGDDLLLGPALETVIKSLGLEDHYWRQRAVDSWSQVVGPEIAAHTRAAGWHDDQLIVEVDEPVWAQQCSLMSRQLLDRINRKLGRQVVGGLRFTTRGRKLDHPTSGRPAVPVAQALPGDLAAKVEKAVSQVKNPDLAGAMHRWMERNLLRQLSRVKEKKECTSCGALVASSDPQDDLCYTCKLEWRPGGLRHRLKMLLRDQPWLTFDVVRRSLGELDQKIYEQVKNRLATEWRSSIARWTEQYVVRKKPVPAKLRGRVVDDAIRYVCLLTGCRPDQLKSEYMDKLGPLKDYLF